ncbi:MAG: hypothetical protein VYD78_07520 [Gemmatimonadota bacterium]|nr:hypothetical protein [Gemmatimonadota bacterium]
MMARWGTTIPRIRLVAALFATAGNVSLSAAQETHLIVISGLGGDPAYSQRFVEWGNTFVEAAGELGIPENRITFLGESLGRDSKVSARSTRANVQKAFAQMVNNAKTGDQIFAILIGHGSYTAGESRFNLPGPDMTANDFSLLLDQLSDQSVAFVNLTSASGEFVGALSGPGRVIITATKTGMERNETSFGGYFLGAFAGNGADLNRDDRVSLFEAFEFARSEVAREYETSNRILTEHALLDDNGDGEGSSELEDGPDGVSARNMFLVPDETTAAAIATDDPVLRGLYEEKGELERRIEELRTLRGRIEESRYERELEELLVALALKNREIQAHGGDGA